MENTNLSIKYLWSVDRHKEFICVLISFANSHPTRDKNGDFTLLLKIIIITPPDMAVYVTK